MTLSECCGAATKLEYRSDHPHVYDDAYDLLFPMVTCSKCGKVIGLASHPTETDG